MLNIIEITSNTLYVPHKINYGSLFTILDGTKAYVL